MIRDNIMQRIKDKVPLQPYTTEELSVLYGITTKTFLKWIAPFKEPIGEKIGWYFNIRQVEVVFDKLGWPEKEAA